MSEKSTADNNNKRNALPKNIEELRRLKMEKKEAKRKLSEQQKSKAPQAPPPKPLLRQFKDIPYNKVLSTVSGTLRIMSFNVLAQSLIKRFLFPDSGDILKWKTRRRMVLEEITYYEPDIMALQEVDNYDQFFKESFEKLGYQSHYYHHPIKRHGCVIAYKQSKFTLSDEETVDYNTESYSPPSYMTGNVAQVLAIRSKEHPEVGFIVGNTHLYWRPDAIYERLRQTMIYATRFLEFKGKQSSDVRWISLLLGDFNTTPDDPAYSLLIEESLNEQHMTDLEISRLAIHDKDDDEQEQEEEDANMIDIDTLPKAPELVSKFKNTRLLWNSIYSNTGHISNEFGLFNEPKFTNYTVVFKGALDYLFVEKDALIEVPKILAIPEEKDVLPSLPNRNFGSDHLCLVADVNY